MCEVCRCTSCASCCRAMPSGTSCDTRKAARKGLTASRSSGCRSRRMFRIDATASRLRRAAVRRCAAIGDSACNRQAVSRSLKVTPHCRAATRSARVRVSVEMQVEEGVAAVVDGGMAHTPGMAGVGHHARQAEHRLQHPARMAQQRAAVARGAGGQRQRRRRCIGLDQTAGQVGQQPGDRVAAGHVVVVHQHQLEDRALVDGDEAERLLARRRHEGPVEFAFDGARQQSLRIVARGQHAELHRGRPAFEAVAPAALVDAQARQAQRLQALGDAGAQPLRVQRHRHAHHMHRVVGMQFAPAQHHALEEVEVRPSGRHRPLLHTRARHVARGQRRARQRLVTRHRGCPPGHAGAARSGRCAACSAGTPPHAGRPESAPRCAPWPASG